VTRTSMSMSQRRLQLKGLLQRIHKYYVRWLMKNPNYNTGPATTAAHSTDSVSVVAGDGGAVRPRAA